MQSLEQLLALAGAKRTIVEDPDEYGVVRWRPGVLATLADELGLAALLHVPKRTKAKVADLPDWFRFPVNLTTGDIIQPAFDFLMADVMARGEAAKSSALARAYDLSAYFAFLATCETKWTDADQTTIDEFTLDMVSDAVDLGHDPVFAVDAPIVSAVEGADHDGVTSTDIIAAMKDQGTTPRSVSTVKRRLSTVQSFHRHALPGRPPFDVRGAMNAGRRPQQTVRPFTLKELGGLVEALGPPPSARVGSSSRLWIAARLALVAGLRRMEVCGLDCAMFDIVLDPSEPEYEHMFRITTTKGGNPRDIVVPTWLLLEIRAYIEGERALAVQNAVDASPALLLNHSGARRAPLARLRPETLSYDFRKLMISAALNRQRHGHRGGLGDSGLPHTFHDLRHTCACMTFVDMKGRCADPWLAVQGTLGHKLLATTKDVYLRYVNEFAGVTGDMRQRLITGLLAA